MRLDSYISEINGVGPSTVALLKRLGINTVFDLIDHYPRRYEDYSKLNSVSELQPGEVTVKVRLSNVRARYGKNRGLHITEALASDKTGSVRVTWFNQPYRAKSILNGKEYYLSGTYDYSGSYLGMLNPSIELVSSFAVNTARILPVYPETKGLTSVKLRKIMASIRPNIKEVNDYLPNEIVKNSGFEPLPDALDKLHFPKTSADIKLAERSIGFRELFEISLASQLLKKDIEAYRSKHVPINEKKLTLFVKSLEFKLTDTQKKIAWRILKDMAENPHPMNRLVEGDVGSGKTIIAAIACYNVALRGGQVALMAPTELLASQHFTAFKQLFSGFLNEEEIVFLSGSLKASKRKEVNQLIASGKAKILIGTHALFQKAIKPSSVQLLIIDEQHRFGVAQREALLGKATKVPHTLTMTATPIPRSLALVLYGELDVSVLDEKPPGRKEVSTELVSLASRLEVLKSIVKNLSPKNQTYLVCPSIDEGEIGDSIQETEAFIKKHFPLLDYRVVHGRMKQEEKDKVMADFSAGKFNLLLATTVIEVGVNIVTARTMAVLSPHRFGLAQLHQLRGRVGRASESGECYLFLADNNRPSKRLQMIARVNDGFKLAEADLELRGPGAIYGTRQSGALDLRLASFSDTKLVKQAHVSAREFVQKGYNLIEYKQLQKKILSLQKVTNLN